MRTPSPAEIGAASALATMGALPLGAPPEEPAEDGAAQPARLAYTIGSISGASLGGGLVGLVAAGDLRGAATGALLTGGLAALANALRLMRERAEYKKLGGAVGVFGLVVVAGSIFLAAGRQGAT